MSARVVETHTAVVVMAGDRAYKAKKPVRFPFVDLTTPDLRRRACEREVELNRRLAPDVYLGVATLSGVAGDADEPVVVMARLPDERRLATLVSARRDDARDELVKVARLLAAFHAAVPRATSMENAGDATARNIQELDAARGSVLDAAEVDAVRTLTTRYVSGRAPLFAERVAHAVDGHGDLLADDIFCLDDGPRVLDCLEFSDALRQGDVLADVAFLAMDVERLGGADLARGFLDAYAEHSGETWPESLEDFWVAQRALVRAKVACIRAASGDPDARHEAHALMRLALQRLRRSRPRLVLVGGTPGTGKSTVAGGVADVCGMTLLRSDAVRKQISGVPVGEWHPETYGRGLYDATHTAATYGELLRRAAVALAHGESVVLDATWLDPRLRDCAAGVAERAYADLVQLRCVAPVDVATRRVLGRALTHSDISDATPEVVARMAAEAPPWPEAWAVDTTGPRERSVAEATARVA